MIRARRGASALARHLDAEDCRGRVGVVSRIAGPTGRAHDT